MCHFWLSYHFKFDGVKMINLVFIYFCYFTSTDFCTTGNFTCQFNSFSQWVVLGQFQLRKALRSGYMRLIASKQLQSFAITYRPNGTFARS